MFHIYRLTSPSKGLKAFWAELKNDPQRYAAYMATRTASLLETTAKKRSALCE